MDEQTSKKWQARLAAAKRVNERLKDRWDDANRLFSGSSPWGRLPGASQIISDASPYINFRIMSSYILSKAPKVYVKPRLGQRPNPQAEKAAKVCEYAANYFLDELDIPTTIAEMLQDAYKYGMGVGWLGYHRIWNRTAENNALYDPDVKAAIRLGLLYRCPLCKHIFIHDHETEGAVPQGLLERLSGSAVPDGFRSPPPPRTPRNGSPPMCPACGRAKSEKITTKEISSLAVEPTPDIKLYMPHFFRVPRRNFLYDPAAEKVQNARWVARSLVLRMEELKAMPGLQNVDKLRATVRLYPHEEEYPSPDTQIPQEPQDDSIGVRVYEIWERKVKKEEPGESDYRFYVLAEGEDGLTPVVEEETPCAVFDEQLNEVRTYPLEGPPVVTLVINHITDRYAPRADLEILRPAYLMADQLRTLALTHARRLVPYLMVDYELDSRERRAFSSLVPDQIIHVRKPDGIYPSKHPSLAFDFWKAYEMVARELRMYSGVNENMQMSRIPGATATEVQRIWTAADLTLDAASRGVERAYRDAIRGIMAIVRHFWTSDQWLWVSAEGGPVQITKELIQAETEYYIVVGSTQPSDDPVRRNMLLTFAKIAAGVPGVNLNRLLRAIGTELEVQDLDQIVPPEPEAEGPEMEMMLMATGVPVPPTQSGNIGRHIFVERTMSTSPIFQDVMRKLPPEQALAIINNIQAHIQGEEAILQGAAGRASQMPEGQQPGPPTEGILRGEAMNLTDSEPNIGENAS